MPGRILPSAWADLRARRVFPVGWLPADSRVSRIARNSKSPRRPPCSRVLSSRQAITFVWREICRIELWTFETLLTKVTLTAWGRSSTHENSHCKWFWATSANRRQVPCLQRLAANFLPRLQATADRACLAARFVLVQTDIRTKNRWSSSHLRLPTSLQATIISFYCGTLLFQQLGLLLAFEGSERQQQAWARRCNGAAEFSSCAGRIYRFSQGLSLRPAWVASHRPNGWGFPADHISNAGQHSRRRVFDRTIVPPAKFGVQRQNLVRALDCHCLRSVCHHRWIDGDCFAGKKRLRYRNGPLARSWRVVGVVLNADTLSRGEVGADPRSGLGRCCADLRESVSCLSPADRGELGGIERCVARLH